MNKSTNKHIKDKGRGRSMEEEESAGSHLFLIPKKKILKVYKSTSDQPITCTDTA